MVCGIATGHFYVGCRLFLPVVEGNNAGFQNISFLFGHIKL